MDIRKSTQAIFINLNRAESDYLEKLTISYGALSKGLGRHFCKLIADALAGNSEVSLKIETSGLRKSDSIFDWLRSKIEDGELSKGGRSTIRYIDPSMTCAKELNAFLFERGQKPEFVK